MAKTAEVTKDKRINKELTRLKKIFKNIEPANKDLTQGLIERAAFIRIELEDLEEDLKDRGWFGEFQQSEKVPSYERQRPAAQSYIQLVGNYSKIIKQLGDLLPDGDSKDAAAELMAFVNDSK